MLLLRHKVSENICLVDLSVILLRYIFEIQASLKANRFKHVQARDGFIVCGVLTTA